ncbi:MAG: hypothetical protein LQ337_008908, partial [Flavoplaca oasis]
MTTWGPALYQSDFDLEMLDLITDEAVRLMSDPECLRSSMMPDSFTLRAPIDRVSTIQQLEDGLLHRLIRRFNHHKNPAAIVILGVVCMELGLRIAPEDMVSIKIALMKWDANKIKKDQVCQAFESYQNIVAVWTFNGKRAVEVPLSLYEMVSEANGMDVVTVPQNIDAQEATTLLPPTITHIDTRSHSTLRAIQNAQQTELEQVLLESDFNRPLAASIIAAHVHARAPGTPTAQPKKQRRYASGLPVSRSQLHFDMPENRMIDTWKPGECMFNLPVPLSE